jgi:exoribonuclease-2
MSSPLRRYVDLVNQWQLIAALTGQRAPYSRNSDALLAALRAFEVTYARYDEHQRAMETYWVLRWLEQEAIRSVEAWCCARTWCAWKGAPLVARVPSLPALDPAPASP